VKMGIRDHLTTALKFRTALYGLACGCTNDSIVI